MSNVYTEFIIDFIGEAMIEAINRSINGSTRGKELAIQKTIDIMSSIEVREKIFTTLTPETKLGLNKFIFFFSIAKMIADDDGAETYKREFIDQWLQNDNFKNALLYIIEPLVYNETQKDIKLFDLLYEHANL